MKIKHLPIALAALMLSACGGSNQNSGGGDNKVADDTITAFQIYKMIDPEKAEKNKEADTKEKMYFSFGEMDWDDFGARDVFVKCYNHNDGGLLAVCQSTTADEMGDSYLEYLKFYRYFNGQLTEQKDLLPTPSLDDFAQVDGLTFYNPDKEVIDFFEQKDFMHYYEFDPETGLLAMRVNLFNDDLFLYYKWDGSKFAPDPKRDPETPQNLISYVGIGQIFLGDNPPENIVGYQKTAFGNMVYFNRNGQKVFKLSLNNEGKIDTITILSPLITFRIDCDGPTNDHFGIGFQDVGYCSADNFVFKDGVWVRSFKGKTSNYCGLMYSSEPFADTLGVIDFYTTKDAITNIYPENGKKVSWRDDPKYDPKATVTLIKIYHRQPEETPGIDMDELWAAIDGESSQDIYKTPEDNLIVYQHGENIYVERYLKAFDIGNNTYKVFNAYTFVNGMNEADYEGETHYIKEYIYKDEKLTEVDLQSELKPYAVKYATDFDKDTLFFLNGTYTKYKFKWDGEKFVQL